MEPFQKKVLVVNDSSATRKLVAVILRGQGYKILDARDGLEALLKIDAKKPDLIILDDILPKMNGYQVLYNIKTNRNFRLVPVIMLASNDGVISKLKGRLAGAKAYLSTPFDPKELIDTVSKYI